MESPICTSCHKPKATLQCGLCKDITCKYCAQFLDEDSFAFLQHIPEDLSHSVYCRLCFDSKVEAQLVSYGELIKQAKEVQVFYKNQTKETRLFKRLEEPLQVFDCVDEEEALLRLAFFAVKANFDTLIDVDIVSEKIRLGSYQTSKCRGIAIPTKIISKRANHGQRGFSGLGL